MAGTDTNKVTINVNGTNVEFTKIGNILGPAGKDGIDGKSIYAKTVDPWSVSGWNPAVAGDLFLNTTTGILWSAKAGAVTSNVQSNWTKVGELAGKITVDSALSSTSTNPVQNKVIKSALDGKAGSNHDHDSRYYTESEIDTKLNKKADSGHSHSYLMNSSGRQFNVPTGGSGGEQKTLVITDDLNAYQPKGNYASSTHKHPISDINNLQSTIDGIYTDMGLQDEAIAGKADSNHDHDSRYYTESEIDTKLNKKADSGHSHSYLMNSSGRQFNVPTGGSGGEQKTLVITDDLNAYQPKGNYASSSHTHSYILDAGNGATTTFAYSKAEMGYGDYTWLAGWNGYELRGVNKSQFATSWHTHTSLKSNTDNRNSNTTPNDYNGVLNIAGLKGNDKIGLDTNVYGTYSCLIGVRGWGDSSGGNAHELAFTGNGHIAHRHGSTTSWGSWGRIAHVSDIPTSLPASNISMSFSNGVLTITYK